MKVECFDMDTKRRTKMPNMINARSKFKPVVAGKYIYVFGGGNKHGDINDCERYVGKFDFFTSKMSLRSPSSTVLTPKTNNGKLCQNSLPHYETVLELN